MHIDGSAVRMGTGHRVRALQPMTASSALPPGWSEAISCSGSLLASAPERETAFG